MSGGWITLGNKIKQVGCCMGYFTWFNSIRGHRYLNEKRFCPISSSFPAILGFWGDFWRLWTNCHKLFYSVCTFYYTQNNRLDLTVSTQKSVLKTNHPGPRNSQKCFLTWHAKPNRQPIMVFLKYLRTDWVIFQTDFCVETVCSGRLFWVQ